MKKLFKAIPVLISCLAMLFVMAGCGGGDASSSVTDTGNTLVYGSQDYTSINPALYEHGEINDLLFAGLTAHDENNQVVPALAEKWEYDEKSKTYTFTLREGLTFHDGEPLTSADVEFTLKTILDEKNGSEIVTNYKDIVKIECPDEKTVAITLSDSNTGFLDYMTIGILPKHLLDGKDITTDSYNQNPVGAGPYKLVEWDQGQSITMEKFDGFYAGAAKIDRVIFKIVPDSDAKAAQINAGDIDMAQVTPKAAADLTGSQDYTIYNMKTADYRAVAYNFAADNIFKKYPELSNILSYGIDRESIIKSVLLGEGEAAYSPIQKNEFNDETMEKFAYDPGKMQSMLESEGWKKNNAGYYEKNGDELRFVISAMADDQVRVDMAKMCAAKWQEQGINVTAESKKEMDWAGQDCCIIGWGSPFDADDHTYKVFTTDAGDNYTGYSNPAADKPLADARHTTDKDKRKELYGNFLEAMTEHMPYTFIAYIDADYAVKNNITGITENTVLGHHGVGIFWNIHQWEMK